MQIRKHLSTVVIALVAGSIGAAGPAVAHGVQHALFAHNADKVDGKHAVGAGASLTQRRGKLVATNATTGRLPNNIIAKAANADALDGLDASEFMRGRIYVLASTLNLAPNEHATVDVFCDFGDFVIGGGVHGSGLIFNGDERSFPMPGESGITSQAWRGDVTATSDPMVSHTVTVTAVCLEPAGF